MRSQDAHLHKNDFERKRVLDYLVTVSLQGE